MVEQCETCKWFKAGEGGVTAAAIRMSALMGRWPSSELIVAGRLKDKDGLCSFMPDGVTKYKTDSCGQYVKRDQP